MPTVYGKFRQHISDILDIRDSCGKFEDILTKSVSQVIVYINICTILILILKLELEWVWRVGLQYND